MQKYKSTIIFLITAFVVVVAVTVFTSQTAPVPVVETKPPVGTDGVYTLADVAKHASANSCWTAINGNVYDLTSFINQHPGGAGAILSTCGIDATVLFENQHGGQSRPEQELAGLQIGTLSQ